MRAIIQRVLEVLGRLKPAQHACERCYDLSCAITDADLDGYRNRAASLRAEMADHRQVQHGEFP